MEKIKSNLKERDIDSAVTGSFIITRINVKVMQSGRRRAELRM